MSVNSYLQLMRYAHIDPATGYQRCMFIRYGKQDYCRQLRFEASAESESQWCDSHCLPIYVNSRKIR